MELWIRSQDKTKIAKIDYVCIGIKDIFSDDDLAQIWGNEVIPLGAYKTKERALEVLDEIQKLVKPKIITTSYDCKCKDNPHDKLSFNVEMNPKKMEIQELSTYVYEMPED